MEITSSLNFEKPNNMKTCSITLNLNNNEELIKKRIKTDIDNFDLKLFPISLQKPKYIPKLLSNPKDSFVYVIGDTFHPNYQGEKFDNLITHPVFKSKIIEPKIGHRYKLDINPKEDFFAHKPIKKSGKIKIENEEKFLDEKILREEIQKIKKTSNFTQEIAGKTNNMHNSSISQSDNSSLISGISQNQDDYRLLIKRPLFVEKLFAKYDYDQIPLNVTKKRKGSAQRYLNLSVIQNIYNRVVSPFDETKSLK